MTAVFPIIKKARAKFKTTKEFAQAMDMSDTTASSLITGKYKASSFMLARAHEIVKGIQGGSDGGTLIVLANPGGFELLYDTGLAMGGQWKLKRKLGKYWLGVLHLPTGQALTSFRVLGIARAKDIIVI